MFFSKASKLKRQLKSPRYLECEQAATELAALGHEGLQALLDALEDWQVRKPAILGLTKTRNPKAVSAIAKLLTDESISVREEALKALYIIGDHSLTPELVAATRDKDSGIRCLAWDAIRKFGDSRAISRVLELRDEDNSVRNLADLAFDRLGERFPEEMISMVKNRQGGYRMAVSVLVRLRNPCVIEPLMQDLEDCIRVKETVYELSQFRWEPKTAKQRVLFGLAKGEWEVVRKEGIHALEPSLRYFEDVWPSDKGDMLTQIENLLNEFCSDEAVDLMLPWVWGRNHDLRRVVSNWLGEIGNTRVKDILWGQYEYYSVNKNAEYWQRYIAAAALARMGVIEPALDLFTLGEDHVNLNGANEVYLGLLWVLRNRPDRLTEADLDLLTALPDVRQKARYAGDFGEAIVELETLDTEEIRQSASMRLRERP